MNLQTKILKQYLALNDQITLKTISEETGIQFTRVFRILNGSKMRLDEYEIIRKKVFEKMGMGGMLEELAHECSTSLNYSAIKEIEMMMKRKIELNQLLTKSNLNKNRELA
jgi:hypothetical protein